LVGFAGFVAFAGFDALADRAALKDRATFVSCALGVVRALFVSIAIVVAREAVATLTDRAALAALEALAFAAFAIVACTRLTSLADFVATLVAAWVARDFFATLDGAFTDVVDFFAAFFADLLADFEDRAGFVGFAAAPRAALTPRFVTLVALRFFGTAVPESVPPTAAPSNVPCGKPQPMSNCSTMRR
jgi:hypothetical protein